jgi:hypothetical protein
MVDWVPRVCSTVGKKKNSLIEKALVSLLEIYNVGWVP